MVSVAHGRTEPFSGVRKLSIRLLQDEQGFQGRTDTVQITSTDSNSLKSNGHITWPDKTVTLGAVGDCAAPVGDSVVVPPGISLGKMNIVAGTDCTQVHQRVSVFGVDSGQLVGVCTRIPNFVDELVIRVEVPSVGAQVLVWGCCELHVKAFERYGGCGVTDDCQVAESTTEIFILGGILPSTLADVEP